MPRFDLDVYKRMKKKVRENLTVLTGLEAGRKLSFDYDNCIFVRQTNAQRREANRSNTYKLSATNDDDLKFPVMALFYEAFRLTMKSRMVDADPRYVARAPLADEIAGAERGIATLLQTYRNQFFKGAQLRVVGDIVAAIGEMKVASQHADNPYSRLDRVFFGRVDTLISAEMKNIVGRCAGNAEIRRNIERTCAARTLPWQYHWLAEASQKIYRSVYSAAVNVQPDQGKESEYYDALKTLIDLKTAGKSVRLEIQGNKGNIRLSAHLRERQQKPAGADEFESRFFWVLIDKGQPKEAPPQARIYVSLFHSIDAHKKGMEIVLDFLLEQDRYKSISGFKIGTLGQERNDTVVIYCRTFDLARAWSAELGLKLKAAGQGVAKQSVPVFQKQVDKSIGVGVGSEPHLASFLPVPAVSYKRMLNGDLIPFIDPNPRLSFGTYLSGVMAVALARAANANRGQIPVAQECAPHLATTFMKFGLDYLKPYRQPVADGHQVDHRLRGRVDYLAM